MSIFASNTHALEPKPFNPLVTLRKTPQAPYFGQKVFGPTTGYIDHYTPQYADSVDWKTVLPLPPASPTQYKRGWKLPSSEWKRLPANQTQWSNLLKRSEDQKTLFNLFLPMARINSVCRDDLNADPEKEMRQFCVQKLKNMGLTEVADDPTLPQTMYQKLQPGKGYFLTDKVGNLLVVLPSNLNLPPSETPELMYTAHMDTVPGFKKDVLPTAWIDKNGYVLVEAGKNAILGADCKIAISTFFMDIAQKLASKEKHPTLMYLLTVDEEGHFIGSKNFNKQWIHNPNRNVDALFAFDHAGMPNLEVYNESPYLERLNFQIKPTSSNLLSSTSPPPKTSVEITVLGESAHATTMARGKSAVHIMAIGLHNFLSRMKDQGVTIEVQDLEGGGNTYSAVASQATARIALGGSPQAVKQALATLKTIFDEPLKAAFDPLNQDQRMSWKKNLKITTKKPLSLDPEASAQRNAANTIAIQAAAQVPQGLLPNRQTINQIIFPGQDSTYLGFDIRGHENEVLDLKDIITTAISKAQQSMPPSAITADFLHKGGELLTNPISKVTTLTRSIYQKLLNWDTPPEFWRTFGLSDLAYLAEPLRDVPNTGAYEQSTGYRNHHIPGTGKRNEQGFSTGEYAHFGEALAAYDFLRAISSRFALGRSQLYVPQNKIEQCNFNNAEKSAQLN